MADELELDLVLLIENLNLEGNFGDNGDREPLLLAELADETLSESGGFLAESTER